MTRHTRRLGASVLVLAFLTAAQAHAQAKSSTPAPSAGAPDPGTVSATRAAAPTPAATTPANEVSEVVVTAERRTTNLQTTPIAATVLNQDDLTRNGVFNVDQLQFLSPSLTVNNFGQGNDIDVRGIGKGEHNTQTGTGVVTYRDGLASFPGYFQDEPFYDVSSVELLRGPQGTFSGQNATGGALIVNTQDPKINGGNTGYILGRYGNYNDVAVQGAVNLPINDTLAARVAFNTEHRDTFYNITGLTKGDPDPNLGSVRGSLLWEPTSALKVLLKVDYNYLDNGGYFGDPLSSPNKKNLFNINNNYETYAVDQFVRVGLKVDYTLPDGIDFRSVTGYQRGRTGWKGDIDGTSTVSDIIAEASDETLWSQEFNLISPTDGPFRWIVGAYYQHNQYDFPPVFDIGFPAGALDLDLQGTNYTHTYAGFGQVSYELPHGLEIQAGLRYSLWSTTNHTLYFVPEYGTALNQPQNDRFNGNNLTGKVSLNWTISARNFVYAFYATGAKPGGLNTTLYTYPIQPIPQPFRQEYVTDYEIGWKSQFFDRHLRTQLGFYYNDFDNFQVSIPIPNNPQFSTELNNTAGATLYGVEAQAQAVFGAFTLDANLGVEHTSLGRIFAEDPRLAVGGVCNLETGPASPTCINLEGHHQTYAPDLTYNLTARYDLKLGNGDVLSPGVTFAHVSDQWGTIFENVQAGDHLQARDILGATVAYTHGDIVVTAFGYNLTDDHYVSALLSPIRLAGNPRQFGVSVLKKF